MNDLTVVLSVYSLRLHSLCLFNVITFVRALSMDSPFGVDRFEWDKFEVCI